MTHGYEMHLDTIMEANVSAAAMFEICAAYARVAHDRGITTAKITVFPRNDLAPSAIFELNGNLFRRTYSKQHGEREEAPVSITGTERPLPPTLKTYDFKLPIQLWVGDDLVADFDAKTIYSYFPAQTMTADCPPAREQYSIERISPALYRYVKALYQAPPDKIMQSLCDLPIVHRVAERAAEVQATATN